MGATQNQVQMEDFERWLSQSLAGKSLAGTRSKRPGRLVFLLRDAQNEVRRCEVYLGAQTLEVRGAWAGAEAVPRLYIRGRFADWLAYMQEPSPERARSLELFGATQVLATLAELLELRQGQIELRAGFKSNGAGRTGDDSLEEDVP